MADKFDAGLAHLVGQGARQTESKKTVIEIDKSFCWRVCIGLGGREFYVPQEGDGHSWAPAPLGMRFEAGWSEIIVDGKVAGVTKIEALILVSSSFTMELVKKPKWWEKKESGGF